MRDLLRENEMQLFTFVLFDGAWEYRREVKRFTEQWA
jgi:hypothetical protein